MCGELVTFCIIGDWDFIFQFLVASIVAGLVSGYVVGITYFAINRKKGI